MENHKGGSSASTFARIQTNPTSKISGPGASAVKYDILTALLVTAAQDDGAKARLALRLSLVITARFNWRLGHFNVGQRELARMWGVTERTAKREIALLRSLGWISVERPAARGRVAQHRIELSAILRETMPHWQAVGPDFEERMSGTPAVVPHPTNVVPLRSTTVSVPAEDGTIWPKVAEQLLARDPAIYAAWFADLSVVDVEAGTLVLAAPSHFVANYVETHFQTRLLGAIVAQDRSIRDVRIISGG